MLYEDNHLLIVNKPAGILTQPSGTSQENLEDICKDWIKKKYHKPGHVFLEAVHRLDKPVSGIVVFGRTSKSLSRLNASMRDHQFQKIYCAVVEGVPNASEGFLEHYLLHDEYQSRIVSSSEPQAKLCRLRFRLLANNKKYSLLEIYLETGRYHQIRAQLAAEGYSIVGDKKYGSTQDYLAQAIALHHSALKFPHPTQEKWIEVQAPIPEAMSKLISF